jgi:uncharacterized RDD family membrane protein YckC
VSHYHLLFFAILILGKIINKEFTLDFDWKSIPLVTPAKRYQGQFIDGFVSFALFIPSLYFTKQFLPEGTLADILTLFLPLGYFLLSDGLPNGQSLGKKLIGISVVDIRSGKACTYFGSFLRNGPSLVLGVIDAALILFRRRQRVGDLFARTVVVYGKPKY